MAGPDLAAKVEALRKLPLFTESVALRILDDHDKGRHVNVNFWCKPCVTGTGVVDSMPKPRPLYPDREEIFCRRCRAVHWKGRERRCFADDPAFLEVVGAPVGTSGRMKTVKDALESAPTPAQEAERARVIRERTESLERDAAKAWWIA